MHRQFIPPMFFRALVVLWLVGGCQGSGGPGEIETGGASSVDVPVHLPLPSAGSMQTTRLARIRTNEGPRFERLSPRQTGIDHVNPIDTNHSLCRLYHSGYGCGGVAIGDVDGDGRPDIFLTSGPGRNRLFRQVGDLEFEDITEAAGLVSGDEWSAGAALADIDNDGDLDIYVCNYDDPNQLFINQGDGTFTEEARSYGVDVRDASMMATFCDYDQDGDLDFYLLTYRYYREGGRPEKPPYVMQGKKPVLLDEYQKFYRLKQVGPNKFTIDNVGLRDYLLRNNGDGTFSEVTEQSGMGAEGMGLSATWWDYNFDGLPDLYVGNDFNDPDHLWRNNGDGTFSDVIQEVIPHTSWFSMGADAADINNDGRIDLLTADMSSTTHFMQKTTMGRMDAGKLAEVAGPPPQIMRNALYLNSGTERVMEAAYLTALADSDWTWAVKLADLDNDGRSDVFITNGIARNFNDSDVPFEIDMLIGQTEWNIFKKTPLRREQNLAFRNEGELQFEDVSKTWGLDHVGMSYACAYGDLDRDGDLDLVVTNLDEPVSVYRNNSADGHRVLVRLVGTSSNHFGIGATVTIETGEGRQVRQLYPMTGFMSSNEPLVHFGLDSQRTILRLTVNWPSGHEQSFEDLPADRLVTIAEPGDAAPEPQRDEPPSAMFRRSQALGDVLHRERPFNDFQRQSLLPNKLSQLGPGMAWGDIDQDGDDDLYLGGAAGQAGQLVTHHGGGHTKQSEFALAGNRSGPFSEHAACEDMASLFFDADQDGDLDLYVASGGVECEPDAAVLKDRLYLNYGDGTFSQAPEGSLPDVRDSSSVVTACDFDRDNDLDLFVGGRSIPGEYPLSPRSRLLRNDQGTFTDVTEQVAPELLETGLVTGALWSDVDLDGWLDLLVTHEWGPVKVYKNEQGQLVDHTQEAGLQELLGWWNGIAARDIDGDGDIDYAVTNFGWNTKYHASADVPALLYYGDFERNGKMRLVEAEYEDKTLFPIRGKSCSTRAMPFLGDKFTSFRDFASASLQEIYTPDCLGEAHRYAATTLSSGLLINDGSGRFSFRELPRLAQVSPGFGVVLTEVNGDGYPDLYLVQNFFSPQAETGRMDGGLSLLLTGSKDGILTPVWPQQSGLVVPGDAKSLTVTDLNDDGWVDFVVGVNDGAIMVFENQGSRDGGVLRVDLQGSLGNSAAYGARVTLQLDDGSQQTAEVHAGSGYLSQSSGALVFGLGAGRRAERITIVWPNGQTTTAKPQPDERKLIIKQPR